MIICKFCNDKPGGCIACPGEQETAQERAMEPMFTADITDERDMQLFVDAFGQEAFEKAFSAGGGGVTEIEYNAALASVLQELRKRTTVTTDQEEL